MHLRQSDIIWNGDSWQLNIVEQKTGKERNCIIPKEMKEYIDSYCNKHNIGPDRRILQMTERNVQKTVKAAREALGLSGISTQA